MPLALPANAEELQRYVGDGELPNAAIVDVIRRSYPELWRQVTQALPRRVETVGIEPGDQLLVRDGQCVSSREKLLKRKLQRRDDDPDAEPRGGDLWKSVDSPVTGVVQVEWERAAYQDVPLDQRYGRLVITTWDALGSPTELLPLRGSSPAARAALAEAFATRSIPVALNRFFGVRMFLVAPDMLLLARPEAHGTDRLQELLKNPSHPDSEHLDEDWPKAHPEAYQVFVQLRDEAFASDTRRAQRDTRTLRADLVDQLLTAVAVPQLHSTLGVLLRMQYAFVQPSTLVGATLVAAGAALQPAWDPSLQLRALEAHAEGG